jgi:hypothetical protein
MEQFDQRVRKKKTKNLIKLKKPKILTKKIKLGKKNE